MNSAPQLIIYRGFNPKSKSLSVHRITGDCLAPEFPSGTLVAIDSSVPYQFGDLVRIDETLESGLIYSIIKQIAIAPDGQTIILLSYQPACVLRREHRIIAPIVASIVIAGNWFRDAQEVAEAEKFAHETFARLRANGAPILLADLKRFGSHP